MAMDQRAELLDRLNSLLREEFGVRLSGLVLFGSEAAQTSTDESDIDLLVLLKGPVNLTPDVDKIITSTYPVQLTCNRALHLIPADVDDFDKGKSSLYRTVKREGVFI